jgi:hypothetical protein
MRSYISLLTCISRVFCAVFYSYLRPVWALTKVPTLSHKWYSFRGEKKWNLNCVFWAFYIFETFLTVRRN